MDCPKLILKLNSRSVLCIFFFNTKTGNSNQKKFKSEQGARNFLKTLAPNQLIEIVEVIDNCTIHTHYHPFDGWL